MKRKRAELDNRIIFGLTLLLIMGMIFTFMYSTVLLGAVPADRVGDTVREWQLESDFFQYRDFYIKNVTYDKAALNCSSNGVNVTISLDIAENFTYGHCTFTLNEYVIFNIIANATVFRDGRPMKPQEHFNITLPDVGVDLDHVIRFCCDNYCNIKTMHRLCK